MEFDQGPNEKIIFREKRHWAVLILPIFELILATIFMLFVFIYFKASWVFSLTFFLWLFLGGFYALKTYLCQKNSEIVFTTERLIYTRQKGIFHKTISEIPREKIEDIKTEIKGFWPSMFEYGSIYLKSTSAEKTELKDIGEPQKVQQIILETIKRKENRGEGEKQGSQKVKRSETFWEEEEQRSEKSDVTSD